MLEVNSCAELGTLFGYGSALFSNARKSSSSRPAASAAPPASGSKKPKQKKGKNNASTTKSAVSVEQAISDLEKVGQVVRSKKAEKKDFTAELTKLKSLKRDYGPAIEQFVKDHINDPEVDIDQVINFLPAKKKKKYGKILKTMKVEVKQAEIARFDTKLYTDKVRTQRKIYHILDAGGDSSTGDFKYVARLNPNLNFKENDQVYCTEKWDGTTVQATRDGVFKRRDLMKRGDPGKHGSSEAERYSLDRLNLENPQYKHIAQAVQPYLGTFKRLKEGVCIYFEAFGPAITGSAPRFQHLNAGGIRVFDSARDQKFLPFEDTKNLASELKLPIVHSFKCRLVLTELLDRLRSDDTLRYNDCDARLEGYVIRSVANSDSAIAKIRVADMDSLEAVPAVEVASGADRPRIFGITSSRSTQIRAAMNKIMSLRQTKKHDT